jgi:ribonucleotide reductase alpha subunit
MTTGIPYDSDEGRAICGALTAIMTGVAYATSAEMAGELGPFPGYKENAENMLRVMRNHRRAAHGEVMATRACRSTRCRSIHEDCPDPADRTRHRGLGQGAGARREARLPQRAGHGDCADRHHRPGHGLRHHRHRARLSRW